MLSLSHLLGKRDILNPHFTFATIRADQLASPAMQEIFRLRYQVYCLERGFLEAAAHANALETDQFDHCATHFAAHSLDRRLVGTVRLVHPGDDGPFPFAAQCRVFDEVSLPPAAEAAEISRLIVKKSFRRRRGDTMEGMSSDFVSQGSAARIRPRSAAEDRRGNSPLLLLGLYREMYRHSRANGIRYWYAAMERSLARSLEKMGMGFVAIGPKTDYYGLVALYMADLDAVEQRMRQENPFLVAWFNDEPMPLWLVAKTFFATLVTGKPGAIE